MVDEPLAELIAITGRRLEPEGGLAKASRELTHLRSMNWWRKRYQRFRQIGVFEEVAT